MFWTEYQQQRLVHYLDSDLRISMPQEEQRVAFIQFYLQRVKEEIPDGINSVSKDSLHNLTDRIGREYAFKTYGEGTKVAMRPVYEKWTPRIEDNFRQVYDELFKSIGRNDADRFCHCVIANLKKTYPDSVLIPTPKEQLLAIRKICDNESKRSH